MQRKHKNFSTVERFFDRVKIGSEDTSFILFLVQPSQTKKGCEKEVKIEPSKYEVVLEQIEKILSARAEEYSSKCSEIQSRYYRQSSDVVLRFSKKIDPETGRFLSLPTKGIITFFLMSWFIPDEFVRIQTQLYLQEKVTMLGPDYQTKLSLILISRHHAMTLLLDGDLLGNNSNEVFGVLLNSEVKVKMVLVSINRKPKKTQRIRGYRDKGSRRLGIEFLSEERKDFSLVELQQQIEERRQSLQDSIQFWKGWID